MILGPESDQIGRLCAGRIPAGHSGKLDGLMYREEAGFPDTFILTRVGTAAWFRIPPADS